MRLDLFLLNNTPSTDLKCIFLQSTSIFSSLSQPLNGPKPMLFTDFGIWIDCKLLQSLKAFLPILVTFSFISTFSSSVQPLNTKSSILVTFSGTSISFSVAQSAKEDSPKMISFDGSFICVSALQLLNTPP